MRGFWIGITAGCAFVLVELAGRLVAGVPTVPELIQDRLVLLLPGPVFSFVLDRLLYLGKPALFTALLLAQVLFAGLGGLVFARWRRPVALALVAWLAIGVVLLPLAGQGIFAGRLGVAVVTLLSAASYAVALVAYEQWSRSESRMAVAALTAIDTAADTSPPLASRRMLVGGGLTFLVSLILGREIVGTLPALPPRPDANVAATDPNLSAAPPSTVSGLPSAVTPPDRFYVVSKNLIDPVVDASSWHLAVDGLVAHPLNLSYHDVLGLPSQETYRTLECISNEVGGDLISNGHWTGVRLADVLRMAEAGPGATTVHFTSVDGYTDNMALSMALDPATLLTYKLDGQPLPSKHGFPLRVLGVGTYGMKNPKWLTRIEVTKSTTEGFWESQGWNAAAIVQTMARIDSPSSGATVRGPAVSVEGIAFAGARGIQRVEVSTDGGKSWKETELQTPLGPNTWTFWRYSWSGAKPGAYTLLVRAIDGTGQVQTMRQADTYPSGATGYHSVDLRVTA